MNSTTVLYGIRFAQMMNAVVVVVMVMAAVVQNRFSMFPVNIFVVLINISNVHQYFTDDQPRQRVQATVRPDMQWQNANNLKID